MNVNVPVRCTVIKMNDGGLLVHNPVAPTRECVDIVKGLERLHGPVKYIVLGTVALEHKAFIGPFSQYFLNADIWLQPGQWSFPINIPNVFAGFPLFKKINTIPSNSTACPWSNEIDHIVLDPIEFKSVGKFSETAFYHKETKTLIVTDIIVKVTEKPPAIIEEDPRAILFHSRDNMTQVIQDDAETRLRGWRR